MMGVAGFDWKCVGRHFDVVGECRGFISEDKGALKISTASLLFLAASHFMFPA